MLFSILPSPALLACFPFFLVFLSPAGHCFCHLEHSLSLINTYSSLGLSLNVNFSRTWLLYTSHSTLHLSSGRGTCLIICSLLSTSSLESPQGQGLCFFSSPKTPQCLAYDRFSQILLEWMMDGHLTKQLADLFVGWGSGWLKWRLLELRISWRFLNVFIFCSSCAKIYKDRKGITEKKN